LLTSSWTFWSLINRRFVKNLTPLGKSKAGEGISNDSVDKQSSGSKFSSFGPTSFLGVYNVKDYQIFNSTLGRLVLICDKAMSNL
jgi:hypothetical protein